MQMCFVVGLIALAVLAIYLATKRRESYTHVAGSLGQLDSLSGYDPLSTVESTSNDNDFASIVRGVQTNPQREAAMGYVNRPMDRLEQLQGESLIPRTSEGVTPYNIAVADTTAYLFLSQQPRVTEVKSPAADYSAATMIRGDIPIKYFPNVPLVVSSQYGRDAWKGDGLFSEYGKAA